MVEILEYDTQYSFAKSFFETSLSSFEIEKLWL